MKNTNFVKTAAGDYVMIDTCFTWDAGLETMAFLAAESNDTVLDWADIISKHYVTEEEAEKGHKIAIEFFKQLDKEIGDYDDFHAVCKDFLKFYDSKLAQGGKEE